MTMRLAWAASGHGVTAQAVIAARKQGLLDIDFALVLVDRPSELEGVAEQYGIPCLRIAFTSPRQFQAAFADALRAHSIDWLGLTFNRILSPEVLDVLGGRVFNLHLALLPAFPGFGPIRKALASGVRITGATLHICDSGMDTGPCIAQAACAVKPTDTESSLGRRLFEASLPMVLQAVRSIERAELRLDEGRRPVWDRSALTIRDGCLLAPEIDEDLGEFASAFCRTQAPPPA